MFLKYNIKNIESQNSPSIINIENYEISIKDGITYEVKITSPKNHYLTTNERIKLSRKDGESNIFEENLSINENYFTDKTFSFSYPLYKKITLNSVNNGSKKGFARFEEKFFLPLKENDTFKIKRGYYFYDSDGASTYIEDMINCVCINDFYFKYDFNHYYKWDNNTNRYILLDTKPESVENIETVEIIPETKLNDNEYLLTIKKIERTDSFSILDERFIKEGVLLDGSEIYKETNYINIDIPILNNNRNDINNEIISYSYFNEKKNELIPDIIDYEKRCFTPYFKNGDNLEPVDKITFNLYLRDREGSDNWTSSDIKGWNQYKLQENNDSLKYKSNKESEGDLLHYLNFTDEDVYYRKEKIKKTFLRLSFYNSNSPFNNMLLFYSTIFLDSEDLYRKYIIAVNSDLSKTETPIIKNKDSNLTLSFSVNDRYNREKSSEGFYLYLFPDNIDNDEGRTIYMKAEFNHAGNGKTIPLIYPCKNNKILKFGDKEFPTSFIDANNGDLQEYYKQSYIPITIKHDKNNGEYVYYFNLVKNNGNGLILNLYEPKINSHS